MRRLIASQIFALGLALMLVACTRPDPIAEPMMDAEIAIEETPMAAPAATKCAPGEGDGIGGTGCAID